MADNDRWRNIASLDNVGGVSTSITGSVRRIPSGDRTLVPSVFATRVNLGHYTDQVEV